MSISAASGPFNGTQSGTYTTLRGGSGSFSRTISNQNGSRTVDTTYTRPDGKTVTQDVTRTKTATGYTRSVSTTLPDGKTTTLQETATRQSNGSFAITGSFTDQNGQTQTLSGTSAVQGVDTTTDLTFTNAAGQTRTRDTQQAGTPDHWVQAVQGTNLGGVAFSDSSALAVLQEQAASSVATT